MPEDTIFFDSSSTSLKLKCVYDSLVSHSYYTNLGRAFYRDATLTESAFRKAVNLIKEYYNITEEFELVITTGTTEAINIVANCFLPDTLEEKFIIGSPIEHHSNYIPWQVVSNERGGHYLTAGYDLISGTFITDMISTY